MDNTQRNSAACIVRGDCSELVCGFVDEFDPCLTRRARASGRAMTGGPVPLLLPDGEAPKVELKRGTARDGRYPHEPLGVSWRRCPQASHSLSSLL